MKNGLLNSSFVKESGEQNIEKAIINAPVVKDHLVNA